MDMYMLHVPGSGAPRRAPNTCAERAMLLRSTLLLAALAAVTSQSPLHRAVENNDEEEVLDVARSYNLELVSSARETPLLMAARVGSPEVIAALIKAGASLKAKRGSDQASPLHIASQLGRREVMELLLKAGAPLHARAQQKATPLHFAAFANQPGSIALLLKAGANIDATAVADTTALHWAAEHGRAQAIEMLLARGASLEAEAASGKGTAHDTCVAGGHSPKLCKQLDPRMTFEIKTPSKKRKRKKKRMEKPEL
eukprot:4076125-Prymnesium_polylepis.1